MSQPFDSLTIHSLRGIKELELSGLGQVNLLVGGNDSGKTTVLEALALLSNPLDPATWVRTAGREQAVPLGISAKLLEQLRWLFPQRAEHRLEALYEGLIALAVNGEVPVSAVKARYKELRGLKIEGTRIGNEEGSPQETELEAEQLLGADIQVDATQKAAGAQEGGIHATQFELWERERTRYLRTTSEPNLPLMVIRPREHQLGSLLVREFSDARMSGLQESVRALLHELDPRIIGLELLAPRGVTNVYLQDSSAGLAPVSAFGDGIRRALLFALTLPRVAGGVLLIDEIETAIHVSALGKVFRWMLDACKQYRVQLFVTTHSLEAVDAILGADTTEAEDIVGFRLERTKERTVAKRYGEDLLKRLRYERGLDVR